jgi:hypothetical protein
MYKMIKFFLITPYFFVKTWLKMRDKYSGERMPLALTLD